MTNTQIDRIWQKPKEASLNLATAKSKVMKGQLVSDWAKAIFASLEAQKEARVGK